MEIEQFLTPAAISAAISALGVVISALVAKRTAVKTAKITTKAEMERLRAEQAYSDKVRLEDRSWEKEDAFTADFMKLSAAVAEYIEKPDRNTKAAAVTACSSLLLSAGSAGEPVKKLSELLRHSNAFEGADSDEVENLLQKIAAGH